MRVILLFAVALLVWGTSWYAIKLEIGDVAPEVAVAWRFAVAATCLFLYAVIRRAPLRLTPTHHGMAALLGLLLFGVNLTLIYYASESLPSGLVCVVFSVMAIMNIVNSRVLLGIHSPPVVWIGAIMGVVGLALIFRHDIVNALSDGAPTAAARGVAFCLAGTYVASLGNIWAVCVQSVGIDVTRSTAWGMAYGAAALFLYATARGYDLAIPTTPTFLGGMIYLAVFSSVIGFTAYLTLVKTIGPARAGYSAIAFPVVALAVSAVLENFTPTADTLIGGAVVVLGNVLVLRPRTS